MAILDSGKQLSEADAEQLEMAISNGSNKVEAHIQLIGYYFKQRLSYILFFLNNKKALNHQAQWLKHVAWLVEQQPENPVLFWPESTAVALSDDNASETLRLLWDNAIQNSKNNGAQALINAASFFCNVDTPKSIQLALRAIKLDSSNSDLIDFCAVYLGIAERNDATSDMQSLANTNKDLLLSAPHNLRLLKNLVQISIKQKDLSAARKYAEQILETNNSDHLAHTAIGLAYVAEKKTIKARQELIESSSDKIFELDFSLADALLEQGERDIVCKYLFKCWRSWPLGRPILLLWVLAIQLGGRPHLKRCI